MADGYRDDDAVNTEEKIWDLTQAINVKGVWYGCKHAVIAMRNVSRRPFPALHHGSEWWLRRTSEQARRREGLG